MLTDSAFPDLMRVWRRLGSGEFDRHDYGLLKQFIATSAQVRTSGLGRHEREQLADDVVRRLWRSAVAQGERWLDRAVSSDSPEAAVRRYLIVAARSELIDRSRGWSGVNCDVEVSEPEPTRGALRDWVPVRLWDDILDPTTGSIDDVLEQRLLSLLYPITDERERTLLRFRVRCRLASPAELPGLVTAFLYGGEPGVDDSAETDDDLRRRRNKLDKAMSRLASRLWGRVQSPHMRPSHRQRAQRVLLELFGATLLRRAETSRTGARRRGDDGLADAVRGPDDPETVSWDDGGAAHA